MNKNLKNFSAYVICSKIFQKPLQGNHGTSESDLTSLKRGVRYRERLNEHEAWYRTLDAVNLLGVFQAKVGQLHPYLSLSKDIRPQLDSTKSYLQRANSRRGIGSVKDRELNAEFINIYETLVEVYEMLLPLESEMQKCLEDMKKNKSGNVEWKDLTSLDFLKYDPQTNSFVETTEKGE